MWKCEVTQSCLTLCDPYTVHGILQARILEWIAFPFSRGSSQPRNRTQVSHIAGGFFTSCNSTQFWHCLPRDRVGSWRLRDQSHKTASYLQLHMKIADPSCHLCFWLTGCRLKVLMTLPLGLINFLGWPTELRETCTCIYQLVKGYDKEYRWPARWRDT